MMYSEGKKETANRSGGSRECFKLKLLIPSGIYLGTLSGPLCAGATSMYWRNEE